MTVRTRTPDTAARARGISPDVENHTKQMLESILRPHSLEELYALVGSFPFKAVKVAQDSRFNSTRTRMLPVGIVITVLGPSDDVAFQTDTITGRAIKLSKQWRLSGD